MLLKRAFCVTVRLGTAVAFCCYLFLCPLLLWPHFMSQSRWTKLRVCLTKIAQKENKLVVVDLYCIFWTSDKHCDGGWFSDLRNQYHGAHRRGRDQVCLVDGASSYIGLQDHPEGEAICWLCRWLERGLEKATLNFHSFPRLSNTLWTLKQTNKQTILYQTTGSLPRWSSMLVMQMNRMSMQSLEKASLNFHSFPRLSKHYEPWNKQINNLISDYSIIPKGRQHAGYAGE